MALPANAPYEGFEHAQAISPLGSHARSACWPPADLGLLSAACVSQRKAQLRWSMPSSAALRLIHAQRLRRTGAWRLVWLAAPAGAGEDGHALVALRLVDEQVTFGDVLAEGETVVLAHALLTADQPGPGARSACLEARPPPLLPGAAAAGRTAEKAGTRHDCIEASARGLWCQSPSVACSPCDP